MCLLNISCSDKKKSLNGVWELASKKNEESNISAASFVLTFGKELKFEDGKCIIKLFNSNEMVLDVEVKENAYYIGCPDAFYIFKKVEKDIIEFEVMDTKIQYKKVSCLQINPSVK